MKRHLENKNWNEYNWEREIRRDEKRISRYFKELPLCMDLPGEEDIIMKKLMSQPDLVPTNAEWNGFVFGENFLEEDDDFMFGSDWKQKKGADIFIQVEKLASDWNVIFASKLRTANLKEGLAVICIMGKLLSRCSDMLGIDTDDMQPLKISLAKRVLSDINELIGALRNIRNIQPGLDQEITGFTDHLQNIREKTIDILNEMKHIK